MRKIIFIVAFIALVSLSETGYAQTSTAVVATESTIKFDRTTHNFGSIPQGTPVTTEFKLINQGTIPVIISDVRTSCGCTTPVYSKEPVAPGKSTTITVGYNAANIGDFNKSITVSTNVGEPTYLNIQGTVKTNAPVPTPAPNAPKQ